MGSPSRANESASARDGVKSWRENAGNERRKLPKRERQRELLCYDGSLVLETRAREGRVRALEASLSFFPDEMSPPKRRGVKRGRREGSKLLLCMSRKWGNLVGEKIFFLLNLCFMEEC